MKPKSENLFHFTKSIAKLMSILKNGIFPRYCLEDIEWMGLRNHNFFAFPISCFCDIPLSRISEHTNFYGHYGIGLTKSWGLKNQLNPVVYAPLNGHIHSLMGHLFFLRLEGKTKVISEILDVRAFNLWALMKPLSGKMKLKDEAIEKEFYQENEWRYVPPVDLLMTQEDYEQNRDEENKKIEKYKLEFSPCDIKYIFVKDDEEIPKIIDCLNENFKDCSSNELKILLTRINSLETLKNDL